jgi:hypothetical protein
VEGPAPNETGKTPSSLRARDVVVPGTLGSVAPADQRERKRKDCALGRLGILLGIRLARAVSKTE